MTDSGVQRNVDPELLLERLGIQFERKGSTLWAKCPHKAHSDRTPSWRIIADIDHAKYSQHRCYGCGWGGWPIHLVEEVLGCDRSEAVEWLKDIEQDPPLPFEVRVEYRRSMGAVFKLPHGVLFGALDTWPNKPRQYARSRGLVAWQVERWGIGYTLGNYDKIQNPLAKRIVFPVRDVRGKLIGYTGRSYNANAKRRYKEPTREEGADLAAVFGEQRWPKHRRIVCITEGALDALAVERLFPSLPVGAIYGSQLFPGHVNRISTFKHVVVATDNDKAGNRVADRLSDELRRWCDVIRVRLPGGKDVADMAIQDPDRLRNELGSALSVVSGDWDRFEVPTRPDGRRRRTEVRLTGSRR